MTFEDLAKPHHVHVVDVEVVHSFEITLHAIWKSLIDQFNDFIIPDLLHCSAMWWEQSKIVILLMPTRKVLTNGHQTAEMDLLQVAYLHLKSILGEDVCRDCIET